MTNSEKVTKIAEILKNRFPNLTVMETITIALSILDALKDNE